MTAPFQNRVTAYVQASDALRLEVPRLSGHDVEQLLVLVKGTIRLMSDEAASVSAPDGRQHSNPRVRAWCAAHLEVLGVGADEVGPCSSADADFAIRRLIRSTAGLEAVLDRAADELRRRLS